MAVGKPIPRKDAPAKVSGRAGYTDDFTMPGMLTAKYLRSTIASGRVNRINADPARALPGVEAVFTFEDVPDTIFATSGHPYSLDPDHSDVVDRRLLTGRVRYPGDEIAIVVAKDDATARRALALIEVDYEEQTPSITAEAALAPDAPLIHDHGNVIGDHTVAAGEPPSDSEPDCTHVLSGRYRTQVVQHCHLENHSTYAYMDDMDRVTIVSSTQIPHIARRLVHEATGIPLGRIRVIKPCLGGGFGNKQDVIFEQMAAWLTWNLGGKPVKIALTREECMIGTRVRHPFRVDARIGVRPDGAVAFIEADAVSLTGAYASHGHSVVSAGAAKIHYMYPRADYRCRCRTVYTNFPASGAMRAYGSPQMTWAIDCLMEEAARAAGMDPVDFRIQNAARSGDVNRLSGKPISTCGLIESLTKGRQAIGWDQTKARLAAETRTGPVRRGLGVAAFSYASGTYPVNVEIAGARLILNQDGSVHLQVGATEIGQGSDTAFIQMAAATVGLDPEMVHIVSTQDTDVAPFDTGAYASRQVYVGAQAVKRAGEKFKTAILDHAGIMTGRAPTDLDIKDGAVVAALQPGQVVISLKDLALDAYYHKDRGGQITAEDSYKTRTNAPAFGCTFVDLNVDIELCRVTINRIINVHDSGRIINPVMAAGQVHGGMGMGLGAALFEELLIDPATGRIFNNNLLDYKLPTIMDTPDLEALFVETDEPTNPYGAKALGEPPILTPPPAIRNAILDATGVAINDMPLNPKNLFRHFKAAGLI